MRASKNAEKSQNFHTSSQLRFLKNPQKTSLENLSCANLFNIINKFKEGITIYLKRLPTAH